MKYAIIECINGNYTDVHYWIASLESAKTQFHGRCQVLWNAPEVVTAYVMIADEQLDAVEGYKKFIHHAPQPEPTPEPEEA